MSEELKVAFLKQCYDVFGPWSSTTFPVNHPLELLEHWPYKATLWEMSCLLKADWYVTPLIHDSKYVRFACKISEDRREIFEKYSKNLISPEKIPFYDYDLIITLDPILKPTPFIKPVVAYFHNEHGDLSYEKSLDLPMVGYDLFFDHMFQANTTLSALPQAIAFPFLRFPALLRECFPLASDEKIWIDARTVILFAKDSDKGTWDHRCDYALGRLEQITGLKLKSAGSIYEKFYNFGNPPNWGDPINYYKALAECKFYISLTARGAGQGLVDAASLGLICLGNDKLIYHRLICHPFCICTDLEDAVIKVKKISQSTSLRSTILEWQDKAIEQHMVSEPIQIIKQAISIKRQSSQWPSNHDQQPELTSGAARKRVVTSHQEQVYSMVINYHDLTDQVFQVNIHRILEKARSCIETGRSSEALHLLAQIQWMNENEKAEEVHLLKQIAQIMGRKIFSTSVETGSDGPSPVEAYLLENVKIKIDDLAMHLGGSWQARTTNGFPITADLATLNFFCERLKEYNEPIVFDIGANAGTYCMLGVLFPQMKCYAFEPVPWIYQLLRRNIELNDLDSTITAVPLALSHYSGIETIKYPLVKLESGLSTLGEPLRFNKWLNVYVRVEKLDTWAKENKVKQCDLIKIDTEGNELFVLKGAEEMIRANQPDLLIEYHVTNPQQFGYKKEAIKDLLFYWGYNHALRISKSDVYFFKMDRIQCASQIKNNKSLIALILQENPQLQDLLLNGQLLEAAIILRDWVAKTINWCISRQFLFDPEEALSSYQAFIEKKGAVWCGGAAPFYMMILKLFHIPAIRFAYAYDSPLHHISHVTVLVGIPEKTDTNHNINFYLLDPYLNYHYVDSRDGNILCFKELLKRIRHAEYHTVVKALTPFKRDVILTPQEDNDQVISLHDHEVLTRDKKDDNRITYQINLTDDRLPKWNEVVDQHREASSREEFLLKIILENMRYDAFSDQAMNDEFQRQLNSIK